MNGEGITNTEYDWCIATLEDSFSSYYFDCDIAISSIESEQILLTGYPRGDNDEYLFGVFWSGGDAVAYDGTMITHTADSTNGQSGAPIWTNGITGDFQVYGIHVNGHRYENSNYGAENYARAITPEIYNAIVEIMLDS